MYEVPVAWLRYMADTLGRDSPVLRSALDAAGIPAQAIFDGLGPIRDRRYVICIETAARLSGDDLFGTNLGLGYDLRASGLAAYVSISAATLRDGMRNATRYGAMNDGSAVYALTEASGEGRFCMDTRSAALRASSHATEFKVAFIVGACRRWLGEGFRPRALRFAHARETSVWDVGRAFGCPVRFGCETTEMLLGADQLDLPVSAADPYLLALLTRHADEILERRGLARDGLRERVERQLMQELPKGVPTARRVASALGMSERTFARRLSAEGVSFRLLVDALRRDMARSYLADPDLSLAQVAYLLGYADQSAFSNSFRRWTGVSPRRFRTAGAGTLALSSPA